MVINDKSQDTVATRLRCGGYVLYYRLSVMFAGERIFKICRYLVKLQACLIHVPCFPCTFLLKGADLAR